MGFFHKALSKYFKKVVESECFPDSISLIEPLFHAYYDWSWYKEVCIFPIVINNKEIPYGLFCSSDGHWIEPTQTCFIENTGLCIESLKDLGIYDDEMLDDLMVNILKIYEEAWKRKTLKMSSEIQKCQIDVI